MVIKKRVWVFCSLGVLLFILAALQYRWIAEASRAEQERLRQNLSLATNRLSHDFESQFLHLGFTGRLIRTAGAKLLEGDFETDNSEQLARQYAGWMASSPYPGLLQDLFITKILGRDNVGLFRFDPQSQALVQSDWPQEFSTFRDFCLGALAQSDRIYRHVEIPSLEHVPALIFPFSLPIPPTFPEQIHRRPMIFTPAEWEIVRINRKAFQALLSRLVEDNFPQKGDFTYDILIAQNASNEVFYRSSPNLNVADFQNRADITRTLNAPIGVAFATVSMGMGVGSVHIAPPAEPPTIANPFAHDGTRGWQFYAKHHSGSLESFARQFRLRNLAVSSAAFALLALGLAFALVASERSRAIGKMQLEFAAGLSHELRTPLTVIRSAGYNLIHGNVSSRDEIVRYGTMIQQEGGRLSDMVEQALLFAQNQSGHYQYERNLVEIASIIEDAIESCREILTKYSCIVVSDIAGDLPQGLTDGKALGQCIRNLLMNALKYGERSGRVEISAQSRMQAQTAEIEISVANQGRVIDAAELPHIFEPFFRGKNAAGIPGNGLGLYMVESIMKAVGGRIEVTSSVKETRFTLHVPASAK